MCDYFLQRMDDDHGGYLADIVRTGGDLEPLLDDASWQLDDHLLSGSANGDFGDPFAVDLQDPLLNPFRQDGTSLLPPPPPPPKAAEQDLVKASTATATSSILPKVHQISPLLISPAPEAAEEMMMMKVISSGCPMAGVAGDHYGGVQISPHMATPGIKRRKSQARKVVYIPAPAAASNRPSGGEVVPSDRWAWRKYGQKPIKGSPYPRGYYRCSSSKGCSARKQVERSRTDSNMLVITYTSEHNHPLPTQRNALAGSVRSHSSKSTTNSTTNPAPSAADDPISPDGEPLQDPTTSPLVNEPDHFERSTAGGAHYRPMIPEAGDQADDFFSDLAELESDPMSLIFSKGFADAKADEAVDPLLSMFDWPESSS